MILRFLWNHGLARIFSDLKDLAGIVALAVSILKAVFIIEACLHPPGQKKCRLKDASKSIASYFVLWISYFILLPEEDPHRVLRTLNVGAGKKMSASIIGCTCTIDTKNQQYFGE